MADIPVPPQLVSNDSQIAHSDSHLHANQLMEPPSELILEPEQPPQAQLLPAPPIPPAAPPQQESRISGAVFKVLKCLIVVAAVTLATIALRMFLSMTNMRSHVMHPSFEDYRNQYAKKYSSQEEHSYRQYVYYQKLEEIVKHNSQQGTSYTKGVNDFSDMTQEQFKGVYLLLRAIGQRKKYIRVDTSLEHEFEEQATEQTVKGEVFPDVNWTHLVPTIKNQYHCAGCYSFPIIASVEALYAQNDVNKTVYSFSEQELIDCAGETGNGCQNGSIEKGFSYIIKNGIHFEKEYPFKSKEGRSFNCTIKPNQKFKVSKLIEIPQGKCSIIEKRLNVGPVVVKLDASNWISYKQGIFDNCGRQVNHGLLVVGRTKDYWVIRNSWGKSWGQYGYIRLAKGNTCGLCDAASYPVLTDATDHPHNK